MEFYENFMKKKSGKNGSSENAQSLRRMAFLTFLCISHFETLAIYKMVERREVDEQPQKCIVVMNIVMTVQIPAIEK